MERNDMIRRMKAGKPSTPRDDPEQSKRFAEAARELGPDETGEAFERAFKKVTTGKPPAPRKKSD